MNLSQGNDEYICEGSLHAGFTSIGVLFMVLVMCCCLLGNAVVCLSILKFPSLQTPSHCLVLSLAVADILVSLIVLPFDIVYWFQFPRWTLGGYACNFWNSAFFLSMTASALNMLSISIDRFIAVVYPLRYKSLVTLRVTKNIIAAVWVYSFGIATSMFFLLKPPKEPVYSFDLHPIFEGYLLLGNVCLPFLVMMVLNSKVYLIARQHLKRMGIRNRIAPMATSNSRVPRVNLTRELRVAKALGIVFIGFLVCWLPFEIVSVIILIDGNKCPLEIADTILCWLAYLHSTVNPIVYGLTINQFRTAFKNIMCCNNTRLNPDSNDSSSIGRHSTYRLKTLGVSNEVHNYVA